MPAAKVITLKCDSTCSPAELAELPAIEAAMNKTLLSDCFLAYFKTPGRRLDNMNGLTPSQIVAKLRIPTVLTLNYFYKGWPSKMQGYEDASDFSVIHFNRRFTSGWPVCTKASLGAHEFSHTKGFFHNGNSAAPNYYTVPYQTNHSFEGVPGDLMPACCQ